MIQAPLKDAAVEKKPIPQAAGGTESLRLGFAKAHRQIIYLRCNEDNGRQTRGELLHAVASGISRLTMKCDLPDGYSDPSDEFADGAMKALRLDFEELRAGSYPVPLPPGCVLLPNANFDPFEHGRTYAWTPIA